ncbi:TPA: LPD7 domain-containing protein [Neisseria bacilliformis]
MANDYAPPTYDEVQAALSYIPTPATHNEWYPIAIAIKDALGENGFTLWDEWSRQGKGYNSSIVKSTWKSATPKPGGITAATLFKLARDNGYRPERPYVPPTPEQTAEREAEQRARDEAAARELAETRRQAARKAYGIWKNADTTVDLNHAYLQRKGIAEAGLVHGIRQNEYQGQRQLVIPLYQGGKLVSVQTINEAGGKHFLKGGEKSGSYAVLGSLEREAHKGIVLAEGFATAASIRKATGAPVVIAFDSGNMIRIAENMATRLPETQRVILAADNDPSGTGLAAASQAAALLGSRARIALPEFDSETVRRFQAAHGTWDDKRERENLPTDFNDLHLAAGIEAVRAQMADALPVPERQPETAQTSEAPRPEAAAPDAAAFSMPAENAGQTEQEQYMAQQPEKQPETPTQNPPHPGSNDIFAYEIREQDGRHYAVFTGTFGKLFNYPVVPAQGAPTEREAREAAGYTVNLYQNDSFIGTAWQTERGQAEVYGWASLPGFMPVKTGKEPQYGVRYENDKHRKTVGYRSDIELIMRRDAVRLAEKQAIDAARQPINDWLAQSGLSAVQAGRARSVLDKRIDYRGYGETTRADFIRERTAEGWTTRRGTDARNGKPTLGIWSPDGSTGYDITEIEKQFADWLAQRQRQSENPTEPAVPSADPEWEQTVADQRRLDGERRAERAPWRDFPPVIRNGGLGSLKNEPEYAAAKGGDSAEAVRLVNKLLKEETVRQFRAMIGDRKPVIVSVLATESAGQNKIPLAMAQALGSRLDLPVDTDIRQINKVSRTGAGIDHRLAFQPVFDGYVEAGRDYLIVDDTLAVGGTVAALRGYIENRGGHVLGAGVMTAHEGALNLPVKQAMIDSITRKHGDAMDNYWKEEFGYGIDRLTQGEAGHLRSAENVDRIRDRINDARLQRIAGTHEQTQPLSPGQQERPEGIASEPAQAAAPSAAAFSMPAANARQAEQEQNMAQQTQTAQPERPSENPARITGVTLVWSEWSDVENRRFKDFDELQQWFEETYDRDFWSGDNFRHYEGVHGGTTYYKNRIDIDFARADGRPDRFTVRADVSENPGDFDPRRQHIADHIASYDGSLLERGIDPASVRNSLKTERPENAQTAAAAPAPESGRSELREKAAKALDTAGSIMDAAALAADAATGNFVGAAALVAAGKVAEHAAGKLMEDMEKQAEKADAANRRQEPPSAAAEPENGIEYGGSRTQDAARSEPETITAAEVRESLRRIRAAERRAATPAETVPEAQERPSENERGVLVAANKEARADTGRPSEKTSAEMQQEKRAQPKPVLDLNYETAAGLDTRYVRYDGRYLDPNNARTVLFEDKGTKIKTAREDAQTVSDMLDTAQAKNWDSIRISGSREFKRQMWLEAELRGIPNSGYSPGKEDLAVRDQMRAARERNSIEAAGLNRTAEAAQRPSERQPENRQPARSPSATPVPDDSVRLKSEAANLQTRAETPAQTRAANRAAETAVQAAGERQSVPEPDNGRTADKSQDPSSPTHALEAARAAYLAKADRLSKAAKEQLANHERDFAEAVKGIPESHRDTAMLHFYTSMQKRMRGTKLDMPEPTAAAERGHTQQPEKPSGKPVSWQRGDGMEMDR